MKGMNMRRSPQAVSVVNFEGLNRVPAPTALREARGEIIPGMENIWYEYVPASYTPGQNVPLVVQLHGGGNDGRRWADMTVWHELAERKGFIVIYPNSPAYGAWSVSDRDIQYLYDLIKLMQEKYSIDPTRIYMQGMSNGDQMTLAFTLVHPEVLAAAGYTTGPSAAEIIDGDQPVGALPIIQMRGEMDINWMLTPETEDVYEKRYSMNDLNRALWTGVNGTDGVIPRLTIEGKDNYLTYEGKNAPIVQWEIAQMGHREPVYAAQVYWDRLYSGCKRVDGKIAMEAPAKPLKEDENTVLIALGTNKVYRRGEILSVGLEGVGAARMFVPQEGGHFSPVYTGEMGETEVMCVPAEFFKVVYSADVAYDAAGDECTITFTCGRKIKLYSNAVLFEDDGEFRAMQKPCQKLCGVFFVPVGELMAMLFGCTVSVADDVMCISDHYAVLGRYTARTIRAILGGYMRPREKAKWVR